MVRCQASSRDACSGDVRFYDWVARLCLSVGLPVPVGLWGEEEGVLLDGCLLPEPPERPVFRDLVRAYELTLHRAGRRKGMGMYYTPPALLGCVLETALEPVIRGCRCQVDAVGALMGLRILDPSCGAGDFLLAAARRVARAVVEVGGGTAGADFCGVLRSFVGCGVYGVDQDPVAVVLTRLNLYLHCGVCPGSHVVCGNALLGVMREEELLSPIPDAAYGALPGDDVGVARRLCRCNRDDRACGGVAGGEVLARCVRDVADLAVAPFLLLKREGVAVPLSSHVRLYLEGRLPADAPELIEARRICRREGVWHWLGAFGAVENGSAVLPRFDCVLGNPPWEKLLVNGREWGASRCVRGDALCSESGRGDDGGKVWPGGKVWSEGGRGSLDGERRRLAALARYLHCNRSRLPVGCSGIINLYAPFLWSAMQLCAPQGRVGMVVPTGLMSDRGTLPMFRALHEGGFLRHFYDFENRRLLFPGVDRRQRFACVTLSRQRSERPARFASFLQCPEELLLEGRVAELDCSVFRRLNPGTHAGVSFRCGADARLALRVHDALPLLGDAWDVELRQGLFNMTADRRLFVPYPGEDAWPLYEGRMFYLFESRFGGYGADGGFEVSAPACLADSRWTPRPRYAVAREAVLKRLPREAAVRGWLPVFRMVTSPTNERSFVCSVLPVAGVGNSAGLLLPRVDDPRLILCLVANMSALVFDYQVRLKLSGNNMNFHIVPRLPVLPPEAYSEADRVYVSALMLRLLYTWRGLDAMSVCCGGPSMPFARGDELERAVLRAELDAWFARRYGLGRGEFAYILDPGLAPGIPGNAAGAATFGILQRQERKLFGEFRTARLCLAAYDALASSEN